MFPFIFDPTFMVLIPALVLSIWAQARIRSAFGRYSEVRARRGVTARDAARAIPVSYTHLDVYKRQTQSSSLNLFFHRSTAETAVIVPPKSPRNNMPGLGWPTMKLQRAAIALP